MADETTTENPPAKVRDWVEWHEAYDRADSRLTRRLLVVQKLLTEALDAQPPGPIRLLSMCAGEGRDVLGVLPDHPRRDDVDALLVELDPELARRAQARAAELGLGNVRVDNADAGQAAAYAGVVPADVLLVCGVFGNITDGDIARTIVELRTLAAPGAWAIWTRGRSPEHDLTPAVRRWFTAAGFREHDFVAPPIDHSLVGGKYDGFCVGAGVLEAEPLPYASEAELFRFTTLSA